MGLGGGAVAKERLTANPTPQRSYLGRERHPEASSSALCRGPISQRVGRVRWHLERDISLMHGIAEPVAPAVRWVLGTSPRMTKVVVSPHRNRRTKARTFHRS